MPDGPLRRSPQPPVVPPRRRPLPVRVLLQARARWRRAADRHLPGLAIEVPALLRRRPGVQLLRGCVQAEPVGGDRRAAQRGGLLLRRGVRGGDGGRAQLRGERAGRLPVLQRRLHRGRALRAQEGMQPHHQERGLQRLGAADGRLPGHLRRLQQRRRRGQRCFSGFARVSWRRRRRLAADLWSLSRHR